MLICPDEESVSKRLKQKASTVDYGGLCHDLAELRVKLAPLMEKGYILGRFINQVNQFHLNEVNTQEIN